MESNIESFDVVQACLGSNEMRTAGTAFLVVTRMLSAELARRIVTSWERLPEPRHPFSLEIISPGRPSIFVNLGPHPPRLWPEDVDLVHDLWLELSDDFGSRLHHRDVVGVALRRMERELHSKDKLDVLGDVRDELNHRPAEQTANTTQSEG